MSLIFARLSYLHKQTKTEYTCQEENIDCTLLEGIKDRGGIVQNSQAKGSQFVILSTVCSTDEEPDSELSLFTKNQEFIIQANKEFVWSNVEQYLPKAMFWFKPNYCVQLGARYIIKQMIGSNCTTAYINQIMQKKEKIIYKSFLNTYFLAKQVYTGQFLNNDLGLSDEFKTDCLNSLLEIANLNRGKTGCYQIPGSILKDLGDPGYVQNKAFIYDNKWHKRGDTSRELCMVLAYYQCIICKQHYSESNILWKHIEEHDIYTCNKCGLQVETYEKLLYHYLTLCRSVVFADMCIGCDELQNQCECGTNFNKIIDDIESYLVKVNKSTFFTSDLLSIIVNYNGNKEKQLRFNHIRLGDGIFGEIQASKQIIELLPKIEVKNNMVLYNNEKITWREITRHLEKHFENMLTMNKLMIKKLLEFTKNCTLCNRINVDYIHYAFNHPVMFDGREFANNIVSYRSINTRYFLQDLEQVKIPRGLQCILCQHKYVHETADYKLKLIVDHLMNNHNKDSGGGQKCPEEISTTCNNESMTTLDFMLHTATLHFSKVRDVIQLGLAQEVSGQFIGGKQTNKPLDIEEQHLSKVIINMNDLSLGKNIGTEKDTIHEIDINNMTNQKKIKFAGSETNNDLEDFKTDDDKRSVKQVEWEHQCFNEDHKRPVMFETALRLKQHILKEHKCPLCAFATMLNADMLVHYQIHEVQSTCTVCYKKVNDLVGHLKSIHAQCVACKIYFEDRQQLKLHEPTCGNFIHNITENKNIEQATEGSLAMDSTDLEGNFSNILIRLLESSNLSVMQKTGGTKIIKQFAAESAISKNRLRLENISVRRKDALFFDIPSFIHSEKSNLPKVLTACSNIKEIDKFDASCETAKQNAVQNFEAMDGILCQMEKYILLGSLNEKQAVSVFELFVTQRIIDEISSYCNEEFKCLSYVAIIETAQFLYIPLNLEFFESKVMAYKQEIEETFLEFASRVYRHLKLCSRLKNVKVRAEYIETNRCKILKNSLPPQVLESVLKKESLFNSFTSRELLDHVVSYSHQSKTRYKSDHFSVRKINTKSGTLRTGDKGLKNGDMRPRSINSRFNKKYVPDMATQKIPAKRFVNYRAEIDKLDLPKISCFKCLGGHFMDQCTVYKYCPLADKMCYADVQGKKVAMGFHKKVHCKHPQPTRPPMGGQFSSKQGLNKISKNQAEVNSEKNKFKKISMP